MVDPWGLSRECSGKTKPDFYVGPAGPSTTMPFTAYRYMRYLEDDCSINARAPKTIESKSAPVTYFGFDKLDSGRAVRDTFQIKRADKLNPHDPLDKSWSNGRLRGEFDTLQLYE